MGGVISRTWLALFGAFVLASTFSPPALATQPPTVVTAARYVAIPPPTYERVGKAEDRGLARAKPARGFGYWLGALSFGAMALVFFVPHLLGLFGLIRMPEPHSYGSGGSGGGYSGGGRGGGGAGGGYSGGGGGFGGGGASGGW